jgi:RNA polymerase sigma-70 factor (ECF subfamily)
MRVARRTVEVAMSETLGMARETSGDWRNEFISNNMRRIFLQVYRIVGNVADAQDLTQEVFIKVLQRAEQIKEGDKAAHWLSRIATNTAIDFLRKQNRIQMAELDEMPEPVKISRAPSPEQQVLDAEETDFLSGGLAQLSERERTALVLRDVDGLPAEEVARELGCSKATVRSHIANARVKFRKYFERNRS